MEAVGRNILCPTEIFMNTMSQLNINTPDMYPPSHKMEDAARYPNKKLNFGVGPGIAIGSLLGLNNWLKKKQRQEEIDSLPVYPVMPKEKKQPKVKSPFLTSGNLYKDIDKLSKNLSVEITPIGVSCYMKANGMVTNFENIEMSQMDDTMLSYWKNKDKGYFKNLILLKIYSEAKIAEQVFAEKMIRKISYGKTASEILDDNCSFVDIENIVFAIKNKIDDATVERFEKIAEDIDCSEDDYEISLDLPGGFSDYSELVDGIGEEKLCFFEAGNKKENKYFDPSFLKKNVKVGFMPDRVIFVSKNVLLGTLPTLNMNEDGYEHFQDKDKKYFKDFFIQESKKGISEMNKNAEELLESADTSDIFELSTIHPLVYKAVLDKKYGKQWVNFDSYATVRIIEKDFLQGRQINDIALNKIIAIQTVNAPENIIFTNHHAFEKAVRCFTDKPIDFLRRENEDLDISDFVFAIDIIQRSMYDGSDVYQKFSAEVIQYIADVLAKKEIYTYEPMENKKTSMEPAFCALLNLSIERSLIKRFTESSSSETDKEKISNKVRKTIDVIQSSLEKGTAPEDATDIERIQIKLQVAVNDFIKNKNELLKKQKTLYIESGD